MTVLTAQRYYSLQAFKLQLIQEQSEKFAWLFQLFFRRLQFLIHKLKLMTEGKKSFYQELNEEQQMIVNSDYKLWKKEAPNQYDFCLLHSLQWPSYSFEWLPQQQVNQNFQENFAIISANAADNQQSQLLKVKCSIPQQGKYQKYSQSTANKDKIQVIQKINLPTPINRARVCRANSNVVATSNSNGDINLFTFKDGLIGRLVAHTAQGYGLSWNNHNASILASGQADKRICLWDVQKNKVSNQKIVPFMEILHHNAPVEDVAWHKHHQNIFASCSDDRMVMLWDMRFRSSQGGNDRKPLFQIVAHTNQVYSLDFSPFNQFLFLSGSGDESTSVWDMRNLTRSVETLRAHSNRVIKVQWNPFISTVFASCSNDRTVCIWDLSKQKKQADSCLLFQHRGHRSKVVDFDWSPHQKLFIGSTQQSNSLHIWEMAQSIYYDDEDSAK